MNSGESGAGERLASLPAAPWSHEFERQGHE